MDEKYCKFSINVSYNRKHFSLNSRMFMDIMSAILLLVILSPMAVEFGIDQFICNNFYC